MAKKRVVAEKQVMTRRKVVAPVMLVKLMEAIGPTRAAERLGVSTTLVHKAKKDNGVNRVVEIAAANILEHLGDTGAARTTPMAAPARAAIPATGDAAVIMAAVPAGKLDVFQRMAAALGIDIIPT